MAVTRASAPLVRMVVEQARGSGLVHRPPRMELLSAITISSFKPTADALPGGATLLHLIDGLGGWALLLALAGLVIGAALWAVGSHSQNYQQSYVGRRAVLVSGVAALLIGAAPTLINFFFSTGRGVVNPLPH
ncbi:MAG TPA: DUF6112 family protein [Acidimicrobiales bacterium]|nr:DUF6112 family protein [Acidimicrobiales bacterium]